MIKIFTKTYKNLNIQEIKITKFPVVIFSDSHTNLANIRKLKELYPDNQFICLGDFTFLFSKPGETCNQKSIDYFIENKIPCCYGNHDLHILSCSVGNSLTNIKLIGSETDSDIYDLTQQQINYLRNLPIGLRLILPDGNHYLCFHHLPNDLWGHCQEKDLTKEQFLSNFPINEERTIAVLNGHLHRNFVVEYLGLKTKRIAIGQLCGKDHHSGENTGGNYALLTENGIEFKKI